MDKNELRVSGEYLRDLRLKKGLTLGQAAEIVGTTAGYLSHIERGTKRNPSYKIVLGLAKLYGLSVEDLIGEAAPPTQAVDLIEQLYKADTILYEGREIDVRDEFVAARIETGIRMGIAWALELIEKRKNEDERRRHR
ncbi:helix-turn-helix domain-containing protein [Effusibacillus pohliae]|uniref:helix-turn-helix domain-containing protein n=1 Tax=Effusibacillus pohliae TaxID=232270 RepID=UPI00037B226E|nr:helix-turn-helix transcriptional regulator [Effusibacillus pohliae]